ncbi:hypothetical protein DSECCO2_401030 [anaerobic digester metagenome]
MKKLFFVILATTVLSISTTAFANEISVKIDNKEITFDQSPVTVDGRTLVPMRGIFEKLGMVVEWDNATKTITAKKDGKEIVLQLNSNEMLVDGNKVTLDVPAQAINGRTMVPVRAISQAVGIDVAWDKVNQAVVIGEGAKEINASNTESTKKEGEKQQVEETSELVKKANAYIAKTNILNNCKDSVALIQNPKSVTDLKTNLNALPSYTLDGVIENRNKHKFASMEQIITLNGKSLESYIDFKNYKNRVLGAIKLNVYDPNSTITFTRFITPEGEVFAYGNSGDELVHSLIGKDFIGFKDEHKSGAVSGVVLKDNIVIGVMNYINITSDYRLSVELFDEYKNESFDSLGINLDNSNFVNDDMSHYPGQERYILGIVKLPKIEFVDYYLPE